MQRTDRKVRERLAARTPRCGEQEPSHYPSDALPARSSGERRRPAGACVPRAGSGALWESRAFAASANMAPP